MEPYSTACVQQYNPVEVGGCHEGSRAGKLAGQLCVMNATDVPEGMSIVENLVA